MISVKSYQVTENFATLVNDSVATYADAERIALKTLADLPDKSQVFVTSVNRSIYFDKRNGRTYRQVRGCTRKVVA